MRSGRHQPGESTRGFELLILLALIFTCAVEVAVWWAQHRSIDELWQDFETSTSAMERVEALFILANRDHPQGLDYHFVRELLRSEHVVLHELAMTHNLTRHSGTRAQKAHLESSGPSQDELVRCRFFLRFEERQFPREALRAYLTALQGVPASQP